MSKYSFEEHYNVYYPDSDIPVNNFGIHEAEKLHEYENALLLKAYKDFHEKLTEIESFDNKYFITLHKKTFESLYQFAGELRNQDVAKGDTYFCKAIYIEQSLSKLFSELESENFLMSYAKIPQEVFAKRIAYFMGELISIHPFWEFNGRIIRMFFDMIVSYNGYDYIDYTKYQCDEHDNPFVLASIECVQTADNSRLQKIISVGLHKII